MYRLCFSPLISIVILVVLAGCADTTRLNKELMSAQDELRQLEENCSATEEKIVELQRENDLLKRRAVEAARERDAAINKLDNFEKRHVLLEARCNDLRRNHQQLKDWAKELAEGYGPGIWTWSARHDLPLYRKPADSATVRGILDELNLYFRRDGNPTLIYRKTEGRTVHLGVSDDMKLTAQMGSTGAAAYIQGVTYSLASLENIDCVYFDIQEGDHAGPGKHCPLGD
ncbi:MAG: hypothetical protein R6V08_06590 [Desulfuromonadales bacterium]